MLRVLFLSLLALACSQNSREKQVASGEAKRPFYAAGDVQNAVASQVLATRAKHPKSTVLVYVGASWCEPCEEFKKALKSDGLPQGLNGLVFLGFDADTASDLLAEDGYQGRFIPRFVVPTSVGKASEMRFEGVPNKQSGLASIEGRLTKLVANTASRTP